MTHFETHENIFRHSWSNPSDDLMLLPLKLPLQWAIPSIFSTANSEYVQNKILPMIGFELRTFERGSNRSANWATATAQCPTLFTYLWFQNFLFLKCILHYHIDKMLLCLCPHQYLEIMSATQILECRLPTSRFFWTRSYKHFTA